jgi:hypothetical protein
MARKSAFEERSRKMREDARSAVAGLRKLQARIRRRSQATLSDREVRSAIEEGRR